MLEKDDKKALEYYLRYIASQHNKKISGLCGIGEHSTIFNKLVERFCVGSLNNSTVLEKIYYFMGKETFGKDLRPYAFFDIDTLIAYNKYLEKVRTYAKGGTSVSRAIDLAMKDMLSSATPIEENGYYNIKKPVGLRMDEDNSQIHPLKRLPSKSFESRYNFSYCENLYDDYLQERELAVSKMTAQTPSDIASQDATTDVSSANTVPVEKRNENLPPKALELPMEKVVFDGKGYFTFHNRRYRRIGKTNFMGLADRGVPIYQIVGRSLADDHNITLTIDYHNCVYDGKFYVLGTQECVDFINNGKDNSGKDVDD